MMSGVVTTDGLSDWTHTSPDFTSSGVLIRERDQNSMENLIWRRNLADDLGVAIRGVLLERDANWIASAMQTESLNHKECVIVSLVMMRRLLRTLWWRIAVRSSQILESPSWSPQKIYFDILSHTLKEDCGHTWNGTKVSQALKDQKGNLIFS